MSLVTVQVMVKTSNSEVWEPVNIKFSPQSFVDAVDANKGDSFIKNIASKSFLGSNISEVHYKYSTDDAERDIREGKKVINKPKNKE